MLASTLSLAYPVQHEAALNALLYTPIEEAVTLLKLRQSKSILTNADDSYIVEIPAILNKGSYGVLARQVGTPNFEMRRFLDMSDTYGLIPVIFEYQLDKFQPQNYIKYGLGRMGFHKGYGRNGGIKNDYLDIINIYLARGKSFTNINTLHGTSLIEFHHKLLFDEYPHIKQSQVYDASSWFQQYGGKAKYYYLAFLTLFLQNAILFETFNIQGSEGKFTQEVVLPAFYKIYSYYNMRPLIVSIDPRGQEGDPYWQLYPEYMKKNVEKYINAKDI